MPNIWQTKMGPHNNGHLNCTKYRSNSHFLLQQFSKKVTIFGLSLRRSVCRAPLRVNELQGGKKRLAIAKWSCKIQDPLGNHISFSLLTKNIPFELLFGCGNIEFFFFAPISFKFWLAKSFQLSYCYDVKTKKQFKCDKKNHCFQFASPILAINLLIVTKSNKIIDVCVKQCSRKNCYMCLAQKKWHNKAMTNSQHECAEPNKWMEKKCGPAMQRERDCETRKMWHKKVFCRCFFFFFVKYRVQS